MYNPYGQMGMFGMQGGGYGNPFQGGRFGGMQGGMRNFQGGPQYGMNPQMQQNWRGGQGMQQPYGNKMGYQSQFGSDPMANMPGRTPQGGGAQQPLSMQDFDRQNAERAAAEGRPNLRMGGDYQNYLDGFNQPQQPFVKGGWQPPQTGGGFNPMRGMQPQAPTQAPPGFAMGQPGQFGNSGWQPPGNAYGQSMQRGIGQGQFNMPFDINRAAVNGLPQDTGGQSMSGTGVSPPMNYAMAGGLGTQAQNQSPAAPQNRQAPPGYYYREDGMMLQGTDPKGGQQGTLSSQLMGGQKQPGYNPWTDRDQLRQGLGITDQDIQQSPGTPQGWDIMQRIYAAERQQYMNQPAQFGRYQDGSPMADPNRNYRADARMAQSPAYAGGWPGYKG